MEPRCCYHRRSPSAVLAQNGQVQFHGRLVFRTTPRGHPFCWEPLYRAVLPDATAVSASWQRAANLSAGGGTGIGTGTGAAGTGAGTGTGTGSSEGSSGARSGIGGVAGGEAAWGVRYLELLGFWGWQFFPLVQRAFAAELARLAPGRAFQVAVLDASGLGELAAYGKRAEWVARGGDATRAKGGDCLHDAEPSAADWYNAHLAEILADLP
jgi:hypothetical protein